MANNEIRIDAREHRIKDVTVYQSDRAIIQRRFPLNVKVGHNTIIIKYLSSALDGDSIRVEAETKSHSQALTVFDVVYPGPSDSSDLSPNDNRQIWGRPMYVSPMHVSVTPRTPAEKAISEEKDALEMRLGVLERHQMLLDGYTDNLRDGRITNTTNESIMSFMDLSLEKQTQLWKEKKRLENDIKALADKMARLGVKEDPVPPKLQAVVTVVLVADEAGPVELVLSYAVRGASWSSLYDLRAAVSGNPAPDTVANATVPNVKLQYRANITQTTGEDWKDVHLLLSTASPVLGDKIPIVQPRRITVGRPTNTGMITSAPSQFDDDSSEEEGPRAKLARLARRSGLMSVESPPRADRKVENRGGNKSMIPERRPGRHLRAINALMGGQPTNIVDHTSGPFAPGSVFYSTSPNVHINDGAISTTFVVDGLSNIPSDGASHKVSIASIDFAAELEWIAVPRNLLSAFLQCRIKNNSAYQLIAGQTSVFLDGNFVAKSSMPNVSPSEFFTCSLGVDPFVRVSLHPQSKTSTTTGGTRLSSFLATYNPKMTVTTYKQRITIRNSRADAAISKLIVQDCVPVSEDANIKVTLLEPKEAALGPVTGLVAKYLTTTADAGEQQLRDQISENVIARWAQRDEQSGASSEARGDGVVEWIISDLKDSVDLDLVFEVTCPSDISVVNAD